MKPLAWNQIYGNWAPVLLPYQEDEQIDDTRLADQVDRLIACQLNGIYTNGTSSEFYNQTEDEFDRISEITASRCEKAGVPFQLGASHPSPWICLQRTRRAAQFAPGAIQITLPDWFPLNDQELIDYCCRLSQAAAPAGLVIYNPNFAKRVLQPIEWHRLKDALPNLAGLKVGGGDASWYEAMRHHAQGISIFIPGHHLATGIQQGAYGSYSNVACLNPRAAQRWYEQTQCDPQSALQLEQRIQQFLASQIEPLIHERGYSHQAADRFLTLLGGWSCLGPNLRWPYRSIPSDVIERIRPIAQAMLPEFFEA